MDPWELLAASPVAVLGTVRPSGRPHLVPITFVIVDDKVVTAVDDKPKRSKRLQRLRNIESDRRVTVLAHHYDEDWRRLWWVRLDGTAYVRPGPPGPDLARDFAAKYSQYALEPPTGSFIEVVPEGITAWSGGGVEGQPQS